MGSLIRVCGIDPSLRAMGLAKGTLDLATGELEITELRLVETEKESGKAIRVNSDDLRRCSILTEALHAWLPGSHVAFAEIPSGAQSAAAAKALGMATAILAGVGIVGDFKGRLIQVTASEVKKLATGSKVASKEEMIAAAFDSWPDAPWLTRKIKGNIEPLAKNEHLADASWAINAGIQTDQFKSLIQLLRGIVTQS